MTDNKRSAETWVTAKGLAKACAWSHKTVYQYVRLVPGFPVERPNGTHMRFDVARVQAFMRDNAATVAAAVARRNRKK